MFLPREWWKLSFLWFANLKSRSPVIKRGLFQTSFKVSILSLAIGVGALSVTLAVLTGFEWTLGRAVANGQGYVLHLPRRWAKYPELEKFVKAAPDSVKSADFFWNSQGLIVGPKGGRGAVVEGRRKAGTTQTDRDATEVDVILGKALASNIGAPVGSTVRLLLPGVLKGAVQARVKGLGGYGLYETDSRLVIVDDESLRSYIKSHDPEAFAKRPGDAHGIRYYLDPNKFTPADDRNLDAWIEKYKKNILAFEPDANLSNIMTWRDQKASLFKGIGYNKAELSVTLSILTLVAALNIAATLVVLFLERDREMAILQALGMSARQILQWICIQGFMLGVISSAIGIGMGRLFGAILIKLPIAHIPSDIYNLEVLPLKYETSEQAMVFGFGVLASVVVSAILGLQFSRINLVNILGSPR